MSENITDNPRIKWTVVDHIEAACWSLDAAPSENTQEGFENRIALARADAALALAKKEANYD